MTKRIEFDGAVHEFPDDFTNEDIRKALASSHAKRPTSLPVTEASERSRQLKGTGPVPGGALNLLPTIGGALGGALTFESGPGAVGGAALGGVAGESARQMLRRKLGFEQPGEKSVKSALVGMGEAGAGQAFNELTGQLGSRALKPVGEYFARTAARGTRVPMLPSQAGVGGVASETAEGFLSHALPSKGIMERFRERQLRKAESVIGDEITRISKFHGTPEQMGQLTQQAVNNSKKVLKQEVNDAYKAIDQLTETQTKRIPKTITQPSSLVDEFGQPMSFNKTILQKTEVGGVQPATLELKKTAIDLLRDLKQQEKLMDPKLLADTRATLTSIINAPRNVPYQTMASSRSDLLAIGRKLDEVLPGKRAGIAKLLANKIDEAMLEAARNSGISGLETQVRAANALTREMHRKFDQQLITKIVESKQPELISSYAKTAGLQEIRDLNALLSPPQRRLVQSQMVRDVLKGAVDEGSKQLDPQKFANGIYALGEHRGKEIFGVNYASVKQLADLMDRIKPTTGSSGAGLHNWFFLRSLPAAGGAALFGHPLAAAGIITGVGGETIFLRKLASAITNPAKSAQVVRYMQMGLRGAPYAVNGLVNVIADEPGLDNAPPPAVMQLQNRSVTQGAQP